MHGPTWIPTFSASGRPAVASGAARIACTAFTGRRKTGHDRVSHRLDDRAVLANLAQHAEVPEHAAERGRVADFAVVARRAEQVGEDDR
jgi:hypothetical protein